MPVDTKHPQYKEYEPLWIKCRTAIEGEDAVKNGAELFLPRIFGQDSDRYAAYKKRALFFNATDRTVQALLGFLFRKPPILTPPKGDEDFFDTVTISGLDFNIFLKAVADEIISVGRVGVLCDAAADGSRDTTPKIVKYLAEDITNWQTKIVNGQVVTVMVTLREFISVVDLEDEFAIKQVEQYRVLDLFDGVYRQRLFQKNKDEWVVVSQVFPSKKGVILTEIPFVFINQTNTFADVEKPTLIDLVNVNYSHYRSSADLEQGRHYTALPTPVVSGFDPKLTNLKIGSGVAWISDDVNAKASFLEFTGQGLRALENALKDKEAMMAVLGARLLVEPKKAVEAADTHKIKGAGEQSILSSIAHTIETGMTWISKVCADWRGLDSTDINIELNKDYVIAEMDAPLVSAWFGALQGAAISEESWFYLRKKWEAVPPGLTFEDEQKLINMRNGVPSGSTIDE